MIFLPTRRVRTASQSAITFPMDSNISEGTATLAKLLGLGVKRLRNPFRNEMVEETIGFQVLDEFIIIITPITSENPVEARFLYRGYGIKLPKTIKEIANVSEVSPYYYDIKLHRDVLLEDLALLLEAPITRLKELVLKMLQSCLNISRGLTDRLFLDYEIRCLPAGRNIIRIILSKKDVSFLFLDLSYTRNAARVHQLGVVPSLDTTMSLPEEPRKFFESVSQIVKSSSLWKDVFFDNTSLRVLIPLEASLEDIISLMVSVADEATHHLSKVKNSKSMTSNFGRWLRVLGQRVHYYSTSLKIR